MPTLKNLVDEVVNIENEIIECRDALKQILIDKKIQGLENINNLNALISKVNEFDNFKPKLYLYKDGDECKSLTNGWSNGGYTRGSGVVLSKNSTNMSHTLTNKVGTATMTTLTNLPIDVTNYTKMKVKYKLTTNVSSDAFYIGFGLHSSRTTTDTMPTWSAKFTTSNNFDGISEIDISNLKGNYYAYIHTDSWGNYVTLTNVVYQIWLEE